MRDLQAVASDTPPRTQPAAAFASSAPVIPLAALYHVGNEGIDYGVGALTWEFRWGEQAVYVDEVGEALGYSLWELHRKWQTSAKTASKHDSSST